MMQVQTLGDIPGMRPELTGKKLLEIVRGKRVYVAGPIRYSWKDKSIGSFHPVINGEIEKSVIQARSNWLLDLCHIMENHFHAAQAMCGPKIVDEYLETHDSNPSEREIMAACLTTIALDMDILLMTNEYEWHASRGCKAEKEAMLSVDGDVITIPWKLELDLAKLAIREFNEYRENNIRNSRSAKRQG